MDEIIQETDPCGKATLKEAHREKEPTMEPANDCDEMESNLGKWSPKSGEEQSARKMRDRHIQKANNKAGQTHSAEATKQSFLQYAKSSRK